MTIEARFRVEWQGFTLDVDLTLPAHGVSALFGHSGSGKTTLLRCVAGLERPRTGRLVVGGEIWQDGARGLPTHRRPIGYVFQEASLFPHLTVMGNLRYGMKRVHGASGVDLDHVIDLLGIGPLLERKPERLSGGERQRVGMARALAVSPRVLLMDEPLAALDDQRKQEILPYLDRLHDELKIPVIYVSHSLDELARLADYMVYMKGGQALATGPIGQVVTTLGLRFGFGGEAESLIEATVADHDGDYALTYLDSPLGRVTVPRKDLAAGHPVRLRIFAHDVSITLTRETDTSILNIFPVTVEEVIAYRESQVLVKLGSGGASVLSCITAKSAALLNLSPGKPVFAQVKSIATLA